MKIFKRACLLGVFGFLSASIVSGKTDVIERDIVRRYQQEVLSNARYNNYKDNRRKAIQYDIDSLRAEINDCNRDISEYNQRIQKLDHSIASFKNKRTALDGELANLMCLYDLGDSTAQSRMSKLQREISQNERNIENYESERSEYSSKLSRCYSNKENLEYKLRQKQRELNRL